jgi:hypothetical protein
MFFSSKKALKVSDTVFLNVTGCMKAIGKMLAGKEQKIVAVWFQEELDVIRRELSVFPEDRFVLAERLAAPNIASREIVFFGHYPIRSSETELCERLGIDEMRVYIHLDAPLLKSFGSDRIKEMMVKMGMNEDEPLNHTMITKAISNAQDMIAKHCITDMASRSEDEWMKANYISGQ